MSTEVRDTRTRLLDAATEAFVKSGYRDAGIREISARAGVNIAAVNYHFGGKEDLYREVLVSAYEQVTTRPMPRLEDDRADPAACLSRWITWNVERLMGKAAHEVFGVLLGREMQQPSPAFDFLVRNAMHPTWMGLVEIVAAVLGRPRDDRLVEYSCMSVFGQCLAYKTARPILARIRPEGDRPPPVKEVAAHIIEFSLAGLEAVRRGERES